MKTYLAKVQLAKNDKKEQKTSNKIETALKHQNHLTNPKVSERNKKHFENVYLQWSLKDSRKIKWSCTSKRNHKPSAIFKAQK